MQLLSKSSVIVTLWTQSSNTLASHLPSCSPFIDLVLHSTSASKSHGCALDSVIPTPHQRAPLKTQIRTFLYSELCPASLSLTMKLKVLHLDLIYVTQALAALTQLLPLSTPISLHLHCPLCCSSNKLGARLPRGLCTCTSPIWNLLSPAIYSAFSLLSCLLTYHHIRALPWSSYQK